MSHQLLFVVLLSTLVKSGLSECCPDTCDVSTYSTDCQQLQYKGYKSGVHLIQPHAAPEPFYVYCDMETKKGGWLYILNRIDGWRNFTLLWDDYQKGFGHLPGEFWLGLEYIHQVTSNATNELLIELMDWNSNVYQAHYSLFSIGGEDVDYRIEVIEGYQGNAGDSFSQHLGARFSTLDRDNDNTPSRFCAEEYGGGGWWYTGCMQCHQTGVYLHRTQAIAGNNTGIYWASIDVVSSLAYAYSFKEVRMMLRPG